MNSSSILASKRHTSVLVEQKLSTIQQQEYERQWERNEYYLTGFWSKKTYFTVDERIERTILNSEYWLRYDKIYQRLLELRAMCKFASIDEFCSLSAEDCKLLEK